MSAHRSSYDRYISVFSPEGKLYQVEYAMNAVARAGITAVAITGKNCVVIVAQRKIREPLVVSSSVTSLFHIHKCLGVCAIGRSPDGTSAVNQTRQLAADYWYHNGLKCPSATLAQRFADFMQLSTQNAGKRILGISLLFASLEQDDDGAVVPEIHKVDSSGYCLAYDAVVIGAYEREGTKMLEKEIKKEDFRKETDVKKLMFRAIACLQKVTREEFKKDDLEIGYMTEANPAFTIADSSFAEGVLNDFYKSR
ncbi:proteasome subunit alpha type 6 [Perkinsela sp. CCAP 1560/4]|nr:proteasome subunit alpha type 6 [Perkinsela sp. CCAP 1560/4]|eukprot:KNH09478.1 proteasome subunit alpha type 6 [Perkinsela sp. CCAP 1560/4]